MLWGGMTSGIGESHAFTVKPSAMSTTAEDCRSLVKVKEHHSISYIFFLLVYVAT